MSIPDYELKTIEEIKRMTKKQAIRFRIDPEKTPKLTDSKFGGMPYWDKGMEYPRKKDGTLLMLLAQINLDELNREGKNPDNQLPKRGMLQFFIDGEDDISGVDFDNTKDEGRDFLYDEIEPSGHWMLGYPYFTQSDPREEYGDRTFNKEYTVQLFQMDSDYGDGEDYIMWGDAGVANFFINKEDLAKEDFGDVLYSWDCC